MNVFFFQQINHSQRESPNESLSRRSGWVFRSKKGAAGQPSGTLPAIAAQRGR